MDRDPYAVAAREGSLINNIGARVAQGIGYVTGTVVLVICAVPGILSGEFQKKPPDEADEGQM